MLKYFLVNGSDFVVDKEFFAVSVTGEATHTVIDCDNIGIKAVNEEIEGIKRGDSAAGRNIYIDTESCNRIMWVIFRISVYSDMAFIKMGSNGISVISIFSAVAGLIYFFRQAFFGDEQSDACPLRIIVLFGDVEDTCPNHFGNFTENIGKTFRVVLFVDVCDIIFLFPFSFCIANVINIETEGFGEIIKSVEFQSFVQL